MQRLFPRDYMPPEWKPTDEETFKVDNSYYIIGERGSGKTSAATAISLALRRMYPFVFVFTKTKTNNYWQQIVPDSKICAVDKISDEDFDGKCGEIIELMVERGAAWRDAAAKEKIRGNPYVLIIFEDCVSGQSLRKLKNMSELALNGRHKFASTMVLSQSLIGLTPDERDNQDVWIIFETTSPRTLNALRESYGNEVLEIAQRVWQSDPRKAFVILNRKGIAPEKRFGWFKTDVEDNKRMIKRHLHLGNRVWWGEATPEEQKKEFPYYEQPAAATLAAQFNRTIGEDDEDEPLTTVQQPEEKDEDGEPQQTQSSWFGGGTLAF